MMVTNSQISAFSGMLASPLGADLLTIILKEPPITVEQICIAYDVEKYDVNFYINIAIKNNILTKDENGNLYYTEVGKDLIKNLY